MICNAPDVEAFLTIQLPIDDNGQPYFEYSDPLSHAADVELYACNNCLEQFSRWEEAKKHLKQRGGKINE